MPLLLDISKGVALFFIICSALKFIETITGVMIVITVVTIMLVAIVAAVMIIIIVSIVVMTVRFGITVIVAVPLLFQALARVICLPTMSGIFFMQTFFGSTLVINGTRFAWSVSIVPGDSGV